MAAFGTNGINNFATPNPSMYIQPVQQVQSGLVWVNGEEGAKEYPVAKGNTVLLLDSQDSNFYLKTIDLTGIVSIRKFKFEEIVVEVKSEEVKEKEVNKEFEDLKSEFKSLKDEISDFKKSMEDLFK